MNAVTREPLAMPVEMALVRHGDERGFFSETWTPAALESASGIFATKKAATVTAFACVPSSEPMPMTKDSGTPSRSVPAAIARPAVGSCCAQGLQPDRLRCSPPAALMSALQSAKNIAPARSPPPVNASPLRS